MSALTINEWPLPAAVGSVAEETEDIGDEARAFDGTLNCSLRATKTNTSIQTIPVAAATAAPLLALLRGDGHTWSFDDATYFVYSSKGLNKASGTGTTLASGKFGRGMRLSSGATMTWAPGTATTWTLMVWRLNGATWEHYILCSDGTKYKDGAVYGSAIAFLAFSGGTLTLGDSGSGANQDFDGLVLLPAVVTAEMAASFGTATTAFGLLPQLLMGGDLVLEGTRTVKGQDVSSEVVEGSPSGSYVILRAVSATLTEV